MGHASTYPGEDRCRGVAVSSQSFVQLVQFLHHRFLVLILPQRPISDQPGVVIQGAAEAGGANIALLLRLPDFHRVALKTVTTRTLPIS